MKYIPIDNVSNIFTKPLLRPKFAKFAKLMGLRRPRPNLGADVRSRLRPHCRTMGMCAGSSRGVTMTKAIVVSNMNDHGGDKHGCGDGSLYQIQMITVVRNMDVEMDHCIKYK